MVAWTVARLPNSICLTRLGSALGGRAGGIKLTAGETSGAKASEAISVDMRSGLRVCG